LSFGACCLVGDLNDAGRSSQSLLVVRRCG